jgi:hypothetical protein
MYAPGSTPNIAASKITSEVAAQQRALYAAQRASSASSSQTVSSDFGNSIVNSPQSSRPPSPPTFEAEDDGSWMTPAQRAKAEMAAKAMAAQAAPSVDHRSLLANSQRCATIPRCTSAPGERPPRKSHPASQPAEASSTSQGRQAQGLKSPPKRAELDACDLGKAQGAARTCVLHVATPRET